MLMDIRYQMERDHHRSLKTHSQSQYSPQSKSVPSHNKDERLNHFERIKYRGRMNFIVRFDYTY